MMERLIDRTIRMMNEDQLRLTICGYWERQMDKTTVRDE